jgi:hypothetical protein
LPKYRFPNTISDFVQKKYLENFGLGWKFSLTFKEEENVHLGIILCSFSFACYAVVKELHTFACSSNMLASVRKPKGLLFEILNQNDSEQNFLPPAGWSPV